MSLTKSEVIEKNRYELQFSVDKATFDAAVNAVYRKQVKNIAVPGFRKGKAPKAIVIKNYTKAVFYDDALNDVLPDAYEAALKESGLDVVARPEFDVEEIKDGEIVERKYLDLTFNLDERICDGFYYANAMKYLLRLLSHPDVLDEAPEVIGQDIP